MNINEAIKVLKSYNVEVTKTPGGYTIKGNEDLHITNRMESEVIKFARKIQNAPVIK